MCLCVKVSPLASRNRRMRQDTYSSTFLCTRDNNAGRHPMALAACPIHCAAASAHIINSFHFYSHEKRQNTSFRAPLLLRRLFHSIFRHSSSVSEHTANVGAGMRPRALSFFKGTGGGDALHGLAVKRLEFKVLSKKCALTEEFDDSGKGVRANKTRHL